MALRISVALTIITNPIVVSLIIEHSFLKIKYQQLTLTEPIIKEKFKDTFIYGFTRYLQVNKKINSKVNSSDNNKTIENTEQTSNSQKHKYLNLKTYLDIDTCNNSHKNSFVNKLKIDIQKNTQNKETTRELCEEKYYNSFNNEFNSNGLERCTSWNDINDILNNSFKELKVTSSKIKNDVINKLERNLKNITKKFAGNYIKKTILQVKVAEERRRIAYRQAIVLNYNARKNDGWTNYGCERGIDYYVNAAAKLLAKKGFCI